MAWDVDWPDGDRSVKANQAVGNNNMVYIQTTMGNSAVGTNTNSTRDHFWDVGGDEDGRHRFIQSMGFTVGGLATDPVIGTGMDGVIYLKEASTDIGRIEGFYRNADGIFQFIPSFLSGTIAIPSSNSYTTIVTVPPNVYGEIVMWQTADAGNSSTNSCAGHFRSDDDTCEAWSFTQSTDTADTSVPLKFASSSSASGLNLRARRSDASSATWNYRITYRAI